MRKRRWVLAAGAAAAAVAVGVGAVMAQTGNESSGTSFLDRVAQKLGIDRPKLDQAIKDARSDEIDQAVADGNLTQKQADALKQRLDSPPAGGGLFLGKFKGELDGNGPGGFGFCGFDPGLGGDAAGIAGFLGITTDQLKTDLQADGATLASVAEARGKSRDDLKAFIQSEAKTKLDQAVANNDLTQKRADEILTNLTARLDDVIDRGPPEFGHFKGGPFRFNDGDDDDGVQPDGTATPNQQSGELAPAGRS